MNAPRTGANISGLNINRNTKKKTSGMSRCLLPDSVTEQYDDMVIQDIPRQSERSIMLIQTGFENLPAFFLCKLKAANGSLSLNVFYAP
jgi:hypothetical protein